MTVVYLTTQWDHGPVSGVGRLPPVQADDPLTKITPGSCFEKTTDSCQL